MGVTKKDKKNAVIVDQAIRCTVEAELASASWETSLKANLHHLPGGAVYFPDFSDMQNIPRAIDPLLPGCARLPSSTEPTDYLLHIRCEPTVDDDDKNLHFDFDVVPCLPENNLRDILLDLVGQRRATNPDQGVIFRNLPAVTRTLRVVQVRCACVPGQRSAAGQAKAETLGLEGISCGRHFRIKDIRMVSYTPLILLFP